MVHVLQERKKWIPVGFMCVRVLLIQVAAHDATKLPTDFFPWYGIHYPHTKEDLIWI